MPAQPSYKRSASVVTGRMLAQ